MNRYLCNFFGRQAAESSQYDVSRADAIRLAAKIHFRYHKEQSLPRHFHLHGSTR